MGNKKTTPKTTRATSKPHNADVSKVAKKSPNMNSVVVEMAWQVAVSFMVLVLGGSFVDSKLDTKPIFTIVGLFLGVAAVFLIVTRLVKANYPNTMIDTDTKIRDLEDDK